MSLLFMSEENFFKTPKSRDSLSMTSEMTILLTSCSKFIPLCCAGAEKGHDFFFLKLPSNMRTHMRTRPLSETDSILNFRRQRQMTLVAGHAPHTCLHGLLPRPGTRDQHVIYDVDTHTRECDDDVDDGGGGVVRDTWPSLVSHGT